MLGSTDRALRMTYLVSVYIRDSRWNLASRNFRNAFGVYAKRVPFNGRFNFGNEKQSHGDEQSRRFVFVVELKTGVRQYALARRCALSRNIFSAFRRVHTSVERFSFRLFESMTKISRIAISRTYFKRVGSQSNICVCRNCSTRLCSTISGVRAVQNAVTVVPAFCKSPKPFENSCKHSSPYVLELKIFRMQFFNTKFGIRSLFVLISRHRVQ